MAEKELSKGFDEIVQELVEVKDELQKRFEVLKKKVKPIALAVAGLIGLKIGLWIFRIVASLLWRHKLIIMAVVIAGALWYKSTQLGCQELTAKRAG